MSLNPIRILKNEAEEEKAEVARMSSFIGAIAIGDLVKSTLGPKGMDKILVSCGRNSGQVNIFKMLMYCCVSNTQVYLKTRPKNIFLFRLRLRMTALLF